MYIMSQDELRLVNSDYVKQAYSRNRYKHYSAWYIRQYRPY